jgi:hypothetical protein
MGVHVLVLAAVLVGSVDEELPPAAPATAPVEQKTAAPLWDGVWDVLVATAGGCLGGLCGAGGGLGCAAVVAGGCTGFLVLREFRAGGTTYLQNASLDGLLYSLLIFFAATPVILMLAALGDAAGYSVALPLWRRKFSMDLVWPLAAMCTALLPGAVVLLAGGAVFLTWLTVQQLPDVLMVVGLGTLGVGALMVVLGAVLVRPLMHLGLHNLWSRRSGAE